MAVGGSKTARPRNQASVANLDRAPDAFRPRRSCTISTTSRTRKSSTRPGSNGKRASERSTKRSRKGICLRTFARLSSLRGNGDLSAYQIVFFPHAHVLDSSDVKPLQDYVEGGGTLVFGCWSGYRDRNHWCYDAPGKAFYENFVGVRVADFTVVAPGETSAMRFGISDASVEAPIFNEVLAPRR